MTAFVTPARGVNHVTLVLALVFMLAATDRYVMSILLQPIQRELGASDAAMGALTGAAFSLVYATASLPLAQLADHGNRRNLIAAAVAAWSLMTAACGMAGSFLTLLLARMGVAVGEAAHQPAAMSMVGDLYPGQRRGIAVSCLTIGSAVGVGAGASIAGFLSDYWGWRGAFLMLAAPGLVVTLLLLFTVAEPRRGAFEGGPGPDAAPGSMGRGLRYLFSVQTIPRLLVAKILLQIGAQGFLIWTPAFFMRVHRLTTTEMSLGYGLAVSLGSIFSMLLAGLLGDWLAKRGECWRVYYCAAALACCSPFAVVTMLTPDVTVAFVALFLHVLIGGGAASASIAAGLGVVRNQSRGLMTAVMAFCISVVGAGVGPVLFGVISDALNATYGQEAIRYSLLTVPGLYLLAAGAFYFAGRTTDSDAAAAGRQTPSTRTTR